VAGERDDAARAQFGAAVQQVPLDRLVFFDECGFALNLHRLCGWLVGGGRLEERVPLQKGQNRSVVGAFSLPDAAHPTGVRALWQKKGAWNARLFTLFVQEAVLPDLPKGTCPRAPAQGHLPKGTCPRAPAQGQRAGAGQRLHPQKLGLESGRRRSGLFPLVLADLLPRPQSHRTLLELAQTNRAARGPKR